MSREPKYWGPTKYQTMKSRLDNRNEHSAATSSPHNTELYKEIHSFIPPTLVVSAPNIMITSYNQHGSLIHQFAYAQIFPHRKIVLKWKFTHDYCILYIDNQSYFMDLSIYNESGYVFPSNRPCVRGLQWRLRNGVDVAV